MMKFLTHYMSVAKLNELIFKLFAQSEVEIRYMYIYM